MLIELEERSYCFEFAFEVDEEGLGGDCDPLGEIVVRDG